VTVASAAPLATRSRTRPGGATLSRIVHRPELPAAVFIALMTVAFATTAENFLTISNLQQILEQVAVVGLIAIGLNFVVLTGEIDISVGSSLAVTATLAATVANDVGGWLWPLATAILAGCLIGLVNGLLVTVARIPSIIVTLGMLHVLRGGEMVFNASGIQSVPQEARALGTGEQLGVNTAVLTLLLVFGVMLLVSRQTSWGRDLEAVGGNVRAARTAGLAVTRTKVIAFVVLGACVGVATMVYIGQLDAVQSNAGYGLELSVIAAVIIGGTSITGGRGSVASALVGALFVGIMVNGMNLLGIVERWQDVFTGGVILLALASDAVRIRLVNRMVTA
jgi:ribose/xylose/arabinose/galactoside ABC-type transport system permease subunit